MPSAIGPAILRLDDAVLGAGDDVLDTLATVLINVDEEVSGVSGTSVLPPPHELATQTLSDILILTCNLQNQREYGRTLM